MDAHAVAIAALSEFANRSNNALEAAGGDPVGDRSNKVSAANRVDATYLQPRQQSHSLSEPQTNGESQPISTSSNTSQTTNTDSHESQNTPPTSDGFSSQEYESQLSQSTKVAAVLKRNGIDSPEKPLLSPGTTAGQKRTASGTVKPTEPQRTTPGTSPQNRHTRTSSVVSNTSSAASTRIGELSSELKARLTYAMVKVQNGWQSLPIDEVESLASQKGSPTSSSSTLNGRRNVLASPRTAIADIQAQNSRPQEYYKSAPMPIPAMEATAPSSSAEQATRTYESFWADHPTSQRSDVTSPSRSLAPPADIRSRPTLQSQRSDTPTYSASPNLHPDNIPNAEQSRRGGPRTPVRQAQDQHAMLRTPSQKSLQEQDALETLLSLSSPSRANANHNFPTSQPALPQGSPLRSEFLTAARGDQPRHVDFSGVDSIDDNSDSGLSSSAPNKRRMGRKADDRIDRMLDDMPDMSSDEEIELPVTPRRAIVRT